MEQKKKKTIKKVLDILSFIGVFVFFGLALTCAIFKFQGAKFNIFGSRYDVIVSDSMSFKNDDYKDFLAGHDDQIQRFDLVKSKPIEKAEDLKKYDIVVYQDREIGTDTHRIVDIIEHGYDSINYLDANQNKIGNYDGIGLPNLESKVETSDLSFTSFEMTVYSEINAEKHYNFSIINTALDCEISSVDAGNGKLVTYKVNKQSTAPGKLTISHSMIFDFSKETIVSMKFNAASGHIETKASDVTFDGGNGVGIYNRDFRFVIRGDAQGKGDPDYYTFDEIDALVVKIIPDGGYFIMFLNSIPGGVMFILLGAIILTYDIVSGVLDKKAAKKAAEAGIETEAPSTSEEPVDVKEVPEEPKADDSSKEEPKVEEPKSEEKPVEQPKVEEIKKPANTPARVNGRFVSKNAASTPEAPAKKSTRWTKENNPSKNKGGAK